MKTFLIQYQYDREAPEYEVVFADTEENADIILKTILMTNLKADGMSNDEALEQVTDGMNILEIEEKSPKQANEWLIWSEEHRAWWKPCHTGYTQLRADAGRYTFDEAIAIVKSANIHLKDVPNEAMIRYEV